MNNFYVYAYLDPRKPGKFVYGNFMFDFFPRFGWGCGLTRLARAYELNYFKKFNHEIA
jgi:hypothetical protein